jgi:hypothetical protein
MVDAADDIYIERRTSCTRDEIAAKLIGWLQGTVRKKFIYLDDKGQISADQFPSAHSLEGSLLDQLLELRETARWEFIDAAENYSELTVIQKKELAVSQWDALIERASAYLAKIDDEIAKGESSALRVDSRATAETGVDHFMIISVAEWARNTLGISLLGTPQFVPEMPKTPQAHVGSQASELIAIGAQSAQKSETKPRFDALASELDKILDQMPNPSPSKVMTVLRGLAGSEHSCVTANVGNGVQWENDAGKVKTLKITALTTRISNWRKRRLSQG